MICSKFQIICISRFQIIQILNVLKFSQTKQRLLSLGTHLWPRVPVMCQRHSGLRFFKVYQSAELNKIVEAMMLVNPYDDCRVSVRSTHGNYDSDIVRASYTRRKAICYRGKTDNKLEKI